MEVRLEYACAADSHKEVLRPGAVTILYGPGGSSKTTKYLPSLLYYLQQQEEQSLAISLEHQTFARESVAEWPASARTIAQTCSTRLSSAHMVLLRSYA